LRDRLRRDGEKLRICADCILIAIGIHDLHVAGFKLAGALRTRCELREGAVTHLSKVPQLVVIVFFAVKLVEPLEEGGHGLTRVFRRKRRAHRRPSAAEASGGTAPAVWML